MRGAAGRLFFFTAPRSVGDGAAGACASSSSSTPCRGDALRVPRSLLRDRAGLLSSFSPARRRSFSCFLALVNDKLFTRSIYSYRSDFYYEYVLLLSTVQ